MKTNPKAKSGRISGFLIPVLAVAGVGGLLAFGMLYYGQHPASAEPAIPAGAKLTSWFDNGVGGRRVLQVYRGSAPPVGTRVTGTVATDTNCRPDAAGLSHCHNRIDLDDGRRIEVIHTHYMAVNPCLRLGQRISIARINKNWVLASNGT